MGINGNTKLLPAVMPWRILSKARSLGNRRLPRNLTPISLCFPTKADPGAKSSELGFGSMGESIVCGHQSYLIDGKPIAPLRTQSWNDRLFEVQDAGSFDQGHSS